MSSPLGRDCIVDVNERPRRLSSAREKGREQIVIVGNVEEVDALAVGIGEDVGCCFIIIIIIRKGHRCENRLSVKKMNAKCQLT